jgi:hypothetical protein
MSILNISSGQIKRAIQIREKLDSLQAELDGLLRGARGNGATKQGKKGRQKMSAAARARIAASARARWKKAKAAGKNRL